MSEADKTPKMEKSNQYIEEKRAYYKAILETMTDDRNPDWKPLNQAFVEMVVGNQMRN